MIGVTIGVGSYRPLAEQAAATMARHTGLRCVVLGDQHYQALGLQAHNPGLLKLWLWDLVQDEDVLLFDADTVCLRDWQPQRYLDRSAVTAVHDWIWRDGIQQEAQSVAMPVEEYFLASLLILHRPRHEPLLQLAREIYPRTSQLVYEQTALNAARYQLGIPLRLLDRRFNWGLFGKGNLHNHAAVIVGHYNEDALRTRWQTAVNAVSDSEVEAEAFAQLGGRYFRYSRVGHDERPILLRPDGTIGVGGGDAERFWFVRQDDEAGTVLVIGSENNVTCELRPGEHGSWRGRWAAHEQMPIEMMPHRGQLICELLGDRDRQWQGAEVGVFEGQTSALLLRALPRLRLWMVDRWIVPEPGDRYFQDPYIHCVSRQQMETALTTAVRLTDFARDRRHILFTDQVTAATCVPDGELDFVFVDSDHSREGTLEAIQAWSPKLRPGGLLIGHDLDYPGFPGVRAAVEETAASWKLPWDQGPDYTWWFRLPLQPWRGTP